MLNSYEIFLFLNKSFNDFSSVILSLSFLCSFRYDESRSLKNEEDIEKIGYKIDIYSPGVVSAGQISYIIRIESHDGSENSWAELDLNQRRHIANEFTVRPH